MMESLRRLATSLAEPGSTYLAWHEAAAAAPAYKFGWAIVQIGMFVHSTFLLPSMGLLDFKDRCPRGTEVARQREPPRQSGASQYRYKRTT